MKNKRELIESIQVEEIKRSSLTYYLLSTIYYLLSSFLFLSCISDPVIPDTPAINGSGSGVIVVNQGIWRGDNAGLTFYDVEREVAFSNWFERQNEGLRLGDTGNDIVVRKGRAYITVSESATIEVIEVSSGQVAGRIKLPGGTFPQHLLILNDSTGWVSCLDNDALYFFNPLTLELGERIPSGPAPEGIAWAAGRLFVANSGLGKLRADEPGAGTISVFNPETGTPSGMIDIGGNLCNLYYVPNIGNLYCFIGAALPDTSGSGLIEIDPVSLAIMRRWSLSGAWEVGFDEIGGKAFIIAQEGIFQIDLYESTLVSENPKPAPFIAMPLSTLSEEVPHSIAVSPVNGEVFIGLAGGYYSAPGRVDRYDREGNLLGSFPTGLNPTAFGFVR